MPTLDPQLVSQSFGVMPPPAYVLQEYLPPEWLGDGPADAAGLEAAAKRLMGEIAIAVADGTTCPIVGLAAYASTEGLVMTGIAGFLAEGLPVYAEIQRYALAARLAEAYARTSRTDGPEIMAFVARCRDDAAVIRSGGSVPWHGGTDISILLEGIENLLREENPELAPRRLQ